MALPTGVLKRGSGIQAIFDQVWVQRKSFLRLANEITLWLFKACFGHHFNPILSWSGFRISRFAKPLRSSTESAVFSQSKLNIIEATVTSELGYLQQKNRCYNLLWHQPWYANVLRTGCSQQSDMAVEKTWTVPQGGPLWTLNSLGISRNDQILLPNSWPFMANYDH